MRKIKVERGRMLSLVLAFIIGCLIGLFVSSYLYYKYVFSNVEDRNATDLARQINTLSRLRLGEVDAVIDNMEMKVDSNIVSIALTPNRSLTDYRRRVLRGAKTYREIYPSKSEAASSVRDALREIQKIDTFTCKTPLCRLVEREVTGEND